VKSDPYDDAYYREHMHELPPLIHKTRDRMIDVHHTILPRTHRITPDALALMSDAVPAPTGCGAEPDRHGVPLRGAYAGRRRFAGRAAQSVGFSHDDARLCRCRSGVLGQARRARCAARAARCSASCRAAIARSLWCGVARWMGSADPTDAWFRRRLFARDDWGRVTNPLLEQAFYIRSHWLRMPPAMLARHLWTKWRKR
jgi:hypothetical protein